MTYSLQNICRVGLAGNRHDVAELFELLSHLDSSNKRQFWDWLKQYDGLLQERLKRAKQRLNAYPINSKHSHEVQLNMEDIDGFAFSNY